MKERMKGSRWFVLGLVVGAARGSEQIYGYETVMRRLTDEEKAEYLGLRQAVRTAEREAARWIADRTVDVAASLAEGKPVIKVQAKLKLEEEEEDQD